MPSDRVASRYRLIQVIGAGGMGRVWLAEDELLQRRVAVKEIAGADGASPAMVPDVRSHTIREARAAARLDHPGIVKVFDVLSEPDRSWIVMEYVESRSLHEAIRADGPLSHQSAARIGLAVLLALRAAHAGGVLHRDVKPHNVLLGDDGRVVLTDFGVATTGDSDGGPVIGSPNYVAPERLRPGATGAAADMWSLGATLYTATEGMAPFARADTSASLAALLADDEPHPPSRPGLLTPIIAELLMKDPRRRLSGADAERHLRRITEGTGGALALRGRVPAQRTGSGGPARGIAAVATTPGRPTPSPPSPLEIARPRTGGPSRWRRSPGRHIALAVLVVTAAVATVAAARLGDDSVPHATATTSVSTMPMSVSADTGTPAMVAPVADAIRVCGSMARAAPIVAATDRVPSGLPAGWLWYRDPAGYAMAVPAGWLRSADGTAVCFSDPAGRRAFTVDTTAPLTRKPLTYWQGREKAALADGSLPGYRRQGMGVLLVSQGGADWEYTWSPDSETRLHVRRILLTTGRGTPYRLTWTTTGADWTAGLPVQRRFVTLFQSAP